LQREPPLELYPLRVTFLVDTDRTILGLWNDEDVEVSSHSDDVVSFVLEVIEKAN
jgi:peroxiredoxin